MPACEAVGVRLPGQASPRGNIQAPGGAACTLNFFNALQVTGPNAELLEFAV